jgi:FkbM family methyltransferase
MSLKSMIRVFLDKFGLELVHKQNDPILVEAQRVIETLRLTPTSDLAWSDTLSLPAAHACIRRMLELHAIDFVLDIGANRGQFAQLLRQLHYRGKIYSFEPLSSCRTHLESMSAGDPNWHIVPFAVGNIATEIELHVFSDETFSSIHAVNKTAQNRFGSLVRETRTERVPMLRLDDWWSENSKGSNQRILLKTDTQGNDLAVLQGAQTVLKSTHAIVTEAAFTPLYDSAPEFHQLTAYVAEQGFIPGGIYPISHRPEDMSLIEADCVFTRPTQGGNDLKS